MTTTPSFVPEPARGPRLASRRIARAAVPLLVLAAASPLHAADAPDEDFKTLVARLQKEKPTFAKRQQDLLAQRYDLADKPAAGRDDVARQAGAGGRPRQASRKGMTWDELAAATPAEIKKRQPLAGRLLPAAAPAPRSRRHDLPEAADRRDEEADRPRPHALRSRLRPPAASAARVPGADLPHDAARSGRRLARDSSSRSTTSTSCSRTS